MSRLARLRSPWSWSLLVKVSVMTAIAFGAMGVAMAQLLQHQVRDRVVADAQQRAETVAAEALDTALRGQPLDVVLPEVPRAALEVLLRQEHVRDRIVEVKLWRPDAVVLYARDRTKVGRRLRPSPPLRRAFAGETASNFDLVEGQDRGDRRDRVFEVYAPLRRDGRVVGVLELYQPYAPVADAIAAETREVAVLLIAGLGFLWVLLLPIVAQASRRLRDQAAENRRQAHEDQLTGLPNRRRLLERLASLTDRVDPGRPRAALLLVDLDRFKDVNDALGHHYGDALLRLAAERLAGVLRDEDLLGRLGGDEFAVVLPRIGRVEDAVTVAERLGEALDEPFLLDGVPVYVEASIGIAVCPDHGRDADALMQHADVAMYAAKAARTGWQVFEDAAKDGNARVARLAELRAALHRDELVLHYQPKIDVATRRVVGVEALVRWQHPERGLLPPGEFVPMAEQTGLIRPLTAYVLNAALAECRRWHDAGAGLTVAVNIAARSLGDQDFPVSVERLLDHHGVPPSSLELEITETGLMHDPARALQNLAGVHAIGVRLSLDDFGKGYSSLSRLRDLPIDQLKIDRSFVMSMDDDHLGSEIVRSTIALGQSLGMHVVAEGVETEESLVRLSEYGCDEAQGFHIARPVPPAEIDRILAEAAAARPV